MVQNRFPALSLAFVTFASAYAGTVSVQISNESAPAGGAVQLKAYLAAPAAVASGELAFRLDPAVFGTVGGMVVPSASGDGCGYASITNGVVDIHFASRTGTAGSVAGQPIVAFTVAILPGAASGATVVSADATGSAWKDAAGNTDAVTVAAGTVTIGATSLWVGDVSPQAGLLTAGATVKITGGGFTASTVVSAPGASIGSMNVAGPGELDVMLGAPADLGGKKFTVQNADGTRVDFFPAAQATALGNHVPASIFDGAVPIFPTSSYGSATSDYVLGGWFLFRNPGPESVDLVSWWTDVGFWAGGQTSTSISPGGAYVLPTGSPIEGTQLQVRASGALQVLELFEYFAINGPDPSHTLVAAMPPAAVPPVQLTANPPVLGWTWQAGAPQPAAQTVQVSWALTVPPQTFTVATATSAGGTWLSVSQSTSANCACQVLTVSAKPGSLGPGIYRGSITLTPTPSAAGTAISTVIPVALTVTAAAPVNYIVGHSGTFSFAGPGSAPQSNTWVLTPDMLAGAFTVDVLTDSGGSWLTASPSSGVTPASVTITVNPASLVPGTYAGLMNVHGPGGVFASEIIARVLGGTELVPSEASVDFAATPAGTAPAQVSVSVSGAPWTASAATHSGGRWLGVTQSGSNVVMAVNAAGLGEGLYTGVVTLTSPSAAQAQIGVTLTVAGASASLAALVAYPPFVVFPNGDSFLGLATGYQVAPFTIAISTADGGTWLSATSFGKTTTPADLQVGVDESSLAGGVYHGDVTVSVPGQSVDIPVTMTVSTNGPYDASPATASVLNAASSSGGAIAPGEILSIRGLALGPATPAGFTLNAQGHVPTTVDAVQVLIDGKPAPLLYVSAQQINAIVPFEVAGENAATVQVRTGAAGATWGIPLAAAQPAIFTADGSGAGQGAVLNQDNSYNGAANPAARGSVVQIFATGIPFAGQVTGSVTSGANNAGNVTVTIGGFDAAVEFAGPAPGEVAGVVQINAVVPAGVTPGVAVPILISAGSVVSPVGVTIGVTLFQSKNDPEER